MTYNIQPGELDGNYFSIAILISCSKTINHTWQELQYLTLHIETGDLSIVVW
jgi:hypothetical protein